MIDIESELYTLVSERVRAEFPGIYMTGEYVRQPASFPAVSFMEITNSAYRRTQTNMDYENHATVSYEVNVYSDSLNGRKAECKRIMNFINDFMLQIGFSRSYLNPVPNMDDATIYRLQARFRAVVGKDHMIYRR